MVFGINKFQTYNGLYWHAPIARNLVYLWLDPGGRSKDMRNFFAKGLSRSDFKLNF